MRVLVIGLDGGTWTALKPLMDEGLIPYMRRLREEGISGILRSTIPPLTAVAWASFQTGVLPGKHGIYSFQSLSRTPKGLEFGVVSASSIRAKTLWEYVGGLGKRVGIINLPMTYPPSPVPGFLVTGFPTPSQRAEFTYPRSLKRELLKAVPNYRVPTMDFAGAVSEDRIADYVERLIQMARARAQAALFLMRRYPWDIMVLQFQETDFLQHPLWHHLDRAHPGFSEEKHRTVARFFQELDGLIESVSQDLAEDDLLMIISDHGFQSLKRIFYPNRWLRREGWLRLSAKPRALIYKALRSVDILGLRRTLLSDSARGRLTTSLVGSEVDWGHSSAYADAGHTGEFNLYLLGLGPEARADLIQRLYDIKDPKSGEGVVDRVLTAREAFGAELTAEAPDLVVCLKEGYIAVTDLKLGRGPLFESKEPSEHYQIGVHHPDGIIVAQGSMIRRGWDRLEAEIIDIVPTILYHLDLPIPSYLDGRILHEIYNPEAEFSKRKVPLLTKDMITRSEGRARAQELSEEEEEQIRKHLRDLGYLD